jgi:hypothetical protein
MKKNLEWTEQKELSGAWQVKGKKLDGIYSRRQTI